MLVVAVPSAATVYYGNNKTTNSSEYNIIAVICAVLYTNKDGYLINMQLKLQKYISFNDLILIAALLVALGLAWNTVAAMQRNYYLQQKYNQLSAEVELQKIKNQNLRYNIEYLKSDEFLELAAREKFNKASPGETLVYLPSNGESQKAVVATNNIAPKKPQETGWRANVHQWWLFLQGRTAIKP